MKKILFFIALALFIGVRIQQGNNETVTQVEAIIRGALIAGTIAAGYCLFFQERTWVYHRHTLIHRFGHINGILAHYMLGQAAWPMGTAITVAMLDFNNKNTFPVLLAITTILSIGQSFIKTHALSHLYKEGLAVDLIGVTISKDKQLLFWDGLKFVPVQGEWCLLQREGKIEFRIAPKEEKQTMELWKFRVVGQK